MDLKAMLNFERLIAPTIIKIVYWVGLAVIVLSGLLSFVAAGYMQGFLAGLLALLAIAFLLLVWRIACELYIVAFGIYERLGAIRDTIGPATLRR